ncbi:MAG TPA: ATP-binding protein [Solirubrobacteraceae bacterium]|nr:ATP-binding protein [Solirubrobacteraceae bacterium]
MPLVDRDHESAGLQAAVAAPPSLVIMTGRRRVGKSFLLSEALRGPRLVSFQADEQGEGGHLEFLSREAATLIAGSPPLTFGSWPDALSFFEAQARQAPVTLVLDEFQWMCNAQPALPSIIQGFWDRWERERVPVCLVLCGSAISFMCGLVDHGQPLYGRATYRPLLEPLDYRWAGHFTTQSDPVERLRRYAVLGGLPQYQVWAGDLPIEDVISQRILTKGAPLYSDPLHLLREEEEIRDPGTYFDVLRAVAEGNTHTARIASRAKLAVANTSKKLAVLTRLGHVSVREPLEPRHRARDRSLYVVADPFMRFWFRYVFPNRSRLERGRVSEVLNDVLADLSTFMGSAFEDCCRQWVGMYAPSTVVGTIDELGAWWSRKHDAEIDIVGMHGQRYTFLASVKWRATIDEGVLDRLYDHRARLGSPAGRARLGLFAREGFTSGVERRAREEGIALVTAADLF